MITFDPKKTTSEAFSLIFAPFSDVFKMDNKLKSDAFFKIFRTAIVADTLFQEGNKKILKNDDATNQFLSLLFESFILYVRMVFDFSTDIIQKYSDKPIKKSYNDLLAKISQNKTQGIDKNLCEHITRYADKFVDLKNIRDSIKRDSTADIYLKDDSYFVFLKYYDKKGKSYKILNEKLSHVVFTQCAHLCILAVRLRKMIEKNKNLK